MNNNLRAYEYEIMLLNDDGSIQYREILEAEHRDSLFWKTKGSPAAADAFARRVEGKFQGRKVVQIKAPNGEVKIYRVLGSLCHHTRVEMIADMNGKET